MDMHLSKIASDGTPVAIWAFPSSDAAKNSFTGLHKFPDLKHMAIAGYYAGELTIPGSAGPIKLINPLPSDNVAFVAKFDTEAGHAAWVKQFADTERGSSVSGVDGDAM